MSIRPLSVSEVSTALDCMARWDFRYGGHLAGSALTPKRTAPILSAGRAWGRAVAAWHAAPDSVDWGIDDPGLPPLDPGHAAGAALLESLGEDADRQREHGVYDEVTEIELSERLGAILQHYTELAERIPFETPEREFYVTIPSRSSSRPSSRYRLLSYVDGIRRTPEGCWLVEHKLRGRLSDVAQIALSRQLRWYAWAYQRETGERIIGALTIERLNEPPKPPRLVKTGRKDESLRPSHAVDQLCTAEAYLKVCEEYDEDPHTDTAVALESRRWQQRVPIQFLDGELEEAGRELVGAARLISQLDSGILPPLRNAKPQNCNGCAFKEICAHPDPELVDVLFERTPPKRLREQPIIQPEGAAA